MSVTIAVTVHVPAARRGKVTCPLPAESERDTVRRASVRVQRCPRGRPRATHRPPLRTPGTVRASVARSEPRSLVVSVSTGERPRRALIATPLSSGALLSGGGPPSVGAVAGEGVAPEAAGESGMSGETGASGTAW